MAKLTATFVSLFPESVDSIVNSSILGRAIKASHLEIQKIQIRDYATSKHRTVDDTPYGGGPGQLMRVDVVANAIKAAKTHASHNTRVILMDPAGVPFSNAKARELASYEHLIFVCGRYEGIDARIEHYVDESISIGDYILTGGELPALVVLDATARYIPQVLGNEASADSESMQESLLEYRQYTRPVEFEGHTVPEVYQAGHHAEIAKARRLDQLERTQQNRPDLFAKHVLTQTDMKLLKNQPR